MIILEVMALKERVVRVISMHTLCLLSTNQCKTNFRMFILFLILMICFILLVT